MTLVPQSLLPRHSLLVLCALWLGVGSSIAEPTADQFATALVSIESTINPDGRTVALLGDNRSGTGVMIDSHGLIVTVGYLLLEASEVRISFYNGVQVPATVVAIDAQSGLALVQVAEGYAGELPDITPVKLGQSALVVKDDRVIVLPANGLEAAASVRIHSAREFSAPWEYLLENALYTMPPVRNFSGAALINREAELIGIGTLALQNITDSDDGTVPGNLFIPVDLLTSRLGTMLTQSVKQVEPSDRAWLGLMVDEMLSVTRVLDASPAMEAGIQAGDIILGINDNHVVSRANLYRSLWSTVSVADDVALLVSRAGKLTPLKAKPVYRSSWFVNAP